MQFSTFSSTREDSITGIYQTLSTVDQQEYLHPSWGSWKEFFNEVGIFSPIVAFFIFYSIVLLIIIIPPISIVLFTPYLALTSKEYLGNKFYRH